MYKQRFNPHKKFKKKAFQKSVSSYELMTAIRSIEVVKKNSAKQEDVSVISPVHPMSFDEFDLAPQLMQNISHKGYTVPTPIQKEAIPAIFSGRDVIGIANTGTGKTAAFLIPLITKVLHSQQERVLVIAPTRELALQIHEELKSFVKGFSLSSILLIGGMSLSRQVGDLKQQPKFVIATPGRLKDIIEGRHLFLSSFHTVVLDEADRMVDIGFIKDIQYFISLLPHDRQSLFFSATIDGKVKEILRGFVHDPITIAVKKQDTAENITQDIVQLGAGQKKIDKLHDLLVQDGFDKVLIFGRTKWGIQKLTAELIRRGFRAAAIHGNKNQNQRQRALQQFKNNDIQILLATDVASRGLDIPDVTHVINYDMPSTMEDYVHRIGRTGRADKKGIALTFVE